MKKQLFTLATIACMLVGSNAFAQNDPLLASILKIVSPVEVSNLIKTLGVQYNPKMLNTSEITKYKSPFKQALNLGVYSSDLGYATVNDQNQDALTYLTKVKGTATTINIKVGQFINTGRIMALAMNKNDLNKLLDETATTFENISDHLDKQKQSNLAALMLTGGWLEMLYITCEVAKTNPNPELNERIIGQKLILDQLLDVLKNHTKDNDVKTLHGKLGELKAIFDVYKIEANTGEAKTVVKKLPDGSEIIETVTDGKSVTLSAEDIAKISAKVTEIRKSVIE
jgi:hypothetical protein